MEICHAILFDKMRDQFYYKWKYFAKFGQSFEDFCIK